MIRAQLFVSSLLAVIMLFLGCAGQQSRLPPMVQDETESPDHIIWEILDHQNMVRGGTVPDWVIYYLEGNTSLIENMEEFQDHYVFISAITGTNFNALEQWRAAFSTDLDFARLVAVRIEKRFLNAAASYPDNEYGSYFEALIRAASDAQWEAAGKEDDFWVYRSIITDDGEGGFLQRREGFDFLILVSIEKNLLVPQIDTLLQNLEPPVPLSRDQRNAVNRVRERFFEGF